jgi:hypothetical protein
MQNQENKTTSKEQIPSQHKPSIKEVKQKANYDEDIYNTIL